MDDKTQEIKNGGLPYYERRMKEWKIDIPGFGTDTGSLTDVVCTLLRTSLYYPFETGPRTRYPDFEPHSHTFEGAIRYLLYDPENFEITEEQKLYYSEQELTLLDQLKNKIHEMNQAKA